MTDAEDHPIRARLVERKPPLEPDPEPWWHPIERRLTHPLLDACIAILALLVLWSIVALVWSFVL